MIKLEQNTNLLLKTKIAVSLQCKCDQTKLRLKILKVTTAIREAISIKPKYSNTNYNIRNSFQKLQNVNR